MDDKTANTPDQTPGQDRIEALLRASLQQRAQDVSPNPETWQSVSSRVQRNRWLRWSLATGGAVAAVVLAAVVLPNLFNGAAVDLTPGGPGGGVVAEGDATFCGGTEHVTAVFARNADDDIGQSTIWALCDDASQSLLDMKRPADASDQNPTLSWDGQSLVFERRTADDQWLLVYVNMHTGDEQILGGGRLPTFSSDGRLAWVQPVEQGQDRILIGRLFSEPELEFPVVDGEDGEWFSARRLAWDSSGEILYAEIGYEGSVVHAYEVGAMERSSVREPLKSWRVLEAKEPDRFIGPGVAQSMGLAAISRCCSAVEGEPFNQSSLVVLTFRDEDTTRDDARTPVAVFEVRLPDEFNVNGTPWAVWAPSGPLRQSSEGAYTWSGGNRPMYVIGDGQNVWTVEPEGEITLIARGVSSMVANVALTASGPGSAPSGIAGQQPGLPDAVATTRQRIWQAADARDFDALAALMASDFRYSFGDEGGRDGAIAMLREMAERGEDPFGLIKRLLDVPFGMQSSEQAPTYFYWPRPFVINADEWSQEDEDILRSLGASDADLRGWRDFGGYIGWRLGISQDGTWQFLIAGD